MEEGKLDTWFLELSYTDKLSLWEGANKLGVAGEYV